MTAATAAAKLPVQSTVAQILSTKTITLKRNPMIVMTTLFYAQWQDLTPLLLFV